VSQRTAEGASEASTGLGAATLEVIGRGVGTRQRRWLVAITLLLGVLAAVALTAAGSPADRTYITVSGPVQSLMSITLPFVGVLLAGDLRRAPGAARVTPTLLAAVLLAAAVGVFGDLVCAVAIGAAAPDPAIDPWGQVATVAVGSVFIQVVAQMVGTGLGLLLRSAIVPFLASIVLPLGLWLVLGSVDILRPAQAWLTPYANLQNLFAGRMHGLAWVQWFVAFLLWGVGLNAVGAARLKRPRRAGGPASGARTRESGR
jgi:hypothetical protein